MISPDAGPNCPPVAGRTYHTADGASPIGSATVGGNGGMDAELDVSTGAVAVPAMVAGGVKCSTAGRAASAEILLAALGSSADSAASWPSDGTTTRAPHVGQMAFFPLRKLLTFSLCPLGHKNLIPIFLPGWFCRAASNCGIERSIILVPGPVGSFKGRGALPIRPRRLDCNGAEAQTVGIDGLSGIIRAELSNEMADARG